MAARGRDEHYVAEFIQITDDPASLPEGKLTRRFFRMLEETIREAPQFYLWTHKRWKRTRAEFDRRYDVLPNGKVVPKGHAGSAKQNA